MLNTQIIAAKMLDKYVTVSFLMLKYRVLTFNGSILFSLFCFSVVVSWVIYTQVLHK